MQASHSLPDNRAELGPQLSTGGGSSYPREGRPGGGPSEQEAVSFPALRPTSLLLEAEIEGRVEFHSADPWVPPGRFSPNRNST